MPPTQRTPFPLVAVAGVIDIALTLVGQPAEYWAGDRAAADEQNAFARPLLHIHSALFAAAALAYLAALGCLLRVWRHRVADVVALLAFAGHTFGGAAWLLNLIPVWGWAAAMVYMAMMVAWRSRCVR